MKRAKRRQVRNGPPQAAPPAAAPDSPVQPFTPRPRLFITMLILLVLWIIILVSMFLLT